MIRDQGRENANLLPIRDAGSFVGPKTVYPFMEAIGLLNDHLTRCDLREEVERERSAFERPVLSAAP